MKKLDDKILAPAGRYYIGDPCYVIKDWSAACDSTQSGGKPIGRADGKEFVMLGTAYGDGGYPDQHENIYCVDSGTIGAVPLRDDEQLDEHTLSLGKVHDFPEPFICYAEGGILHFGHITIDTKDDEEYDDE